MTHNCSTPAQTLHPLALLRFIHKQQTRPATVSVTAAKKTSDSAYVYTEPPRRVDKRVKY